MRISRILLIDKDLEYGRALARAVSNLQNEFEITMQSYESLGIAKIKGKSLFQEYDLIMAGGYPEDELQTIRNEISKCGMEGRIVILTDFAVDSLVRQSEKEEIYDWRLYKYRNVHDMISDLIYLLGVVTGKRNLPVKKLTPVLLAFYSISGGSGKTVIALGTSRELSRYHDKKVLYLSFEEIPATGLWIRNNPDNRNIGDFLYYLFEKKNENLCSRLVGFTASDEFGVETFYPANGRNDLNLLTRDELIFFLNIISDASRYDYIALDLKSDIAEETFFLMNLCGKIIWIQNADPSSEFKTRKLYDHLTRQYDFPWIKNFLLVVNRVKSELGREKAEGLSFNYIKKIIIENDDDSFRYQSNHLDIDISHGFGVGIKRIAEVILESDGSKKSGVEKERGKCMGNSVR